MPGGVGGGGGGGVRGLLNGLSAPASGIRAQKARIDTIAFNLAQAGTSAAPGTEAFRRRVVELESIPPGAGEHGVAPLAGRAIPAPTTNPAFPLPPSVEGMLQAVGPNGISATARPHDEGVRVAGIAEDLSEGALIYDPGHPHADEQGYVRYANVEITQEMVDLLEARRFFEANATVFEAMKSVLRRSIDI
jgi:flagellar basal-body rod protein FlgC